MRAMEAAADAGGKLWLDMRAGVYNRLVNQPAQGAADRRFSSHTL